MLSGNLICPHCGDEKTDKETILPVKVVENHVLHFFCTKCGMGYRVTTQEGQYSISSILAEDE